MPVRDPNQDQRNADRIRSDDETGVEGHGWRYGVAKVDPDADEDVEGHLRPYDAAKVNPDADDDVEGHVRNM